MPDDLERFADLARIRKGADAAIAELIGRPSAPGNIGEFVARAPLRAVSNRVICPFARVA
jgi:hypothetical protein